MKLFVEESGSAAAQELWNACEHRVSCHLLYPEARAALAASARAGRIEGDTLPSFRVLLEQLWQAVDRIEITSALAHAAGDLAERHALRGYDAVHLASFEAIASDDALLVTFDEDLRRTGWALGFTIAPGTA